MDDLFPVAMVCCGDCDHLFNDPMKQIPASMLSCKVKQSTAEERATYKGTAHRHTCVQFIERKQSTPNPMIAAEEYYAKLREIRVTPPVPVAPTEPAQRRSNRLTPTAPGSSATSTNSPFDLGARRAPAALPSPEKKRDPFDLEAA